MCTMSTILRGVIGAGLLVLPDLFPIQFIDAGSLLLLAVAFCVGASYLCNDTLMVW